VNIFHLDSNLELCAQYHCDKHVVKMLVEYAQLLCTAVNLHGGSAPYRVTHKNHPCSIWVRESLENWMWLRDLSIALHKEYTHRYGKQHKSGLVAAALVPPDLPQIGFTSPPMAMPESYQQDDYVQAYRAYYVHEKSQIASWRNRERPKWFVN